jgi:hypothetical protein
MSCVAPLAYVTTKVAVYVSPARKGTVPEMDVELLIVEPGAIEPRKDGIVGTPLLNEVMLTPMIATVPRVLDGYTEHGLQDRLRAVLHRIRTICST